MIRKDARVLLEVQGLCAKVGGADIVKGLDLEIGRASCRERV